MKKLILLLSILAMYNISSSQEVFTKWQNNTLEIDGSDSDWNQRPERYNSETKLIYSFRNDSSNFYLLYEIPEEITQQKFMMGGMETRISIKTKPKLKAEIAFPIGQRMRPDQMEKRDGQNRGERPSREQMKEGMRKNYLQTAAYASISGFLKTAEKISRNLENKNGFTYNIGWNSTQSMIVEISIPLTELFSDMSLSEISLYDVTIKTTLKAMEMPTSGGTQRPPMGGGGNMRGGGMHPGGTSGGEMPTEMKSLFEEQYFKTKLRISSSPTK